MINFKGLVQSLNERAGWELENPNQPWNATNKRLLKVKKTGDQFQGVDRDHSDMLYAISGAKSFHAKAKPSVDTCCHEKGYKIHVESLNEDDDPTGSASGGDGGMGSNGSFNQPVSMDDGGDEQGRSVKEALEQIALHAAEIFDGVTDEDDLGDDVKANIMHAYQLIDEVYSGFDFNSAKKAAGPDQANDNQEDKPDNADDAENQEDGKEGKEGEEGNNDLGGEKDGVLPPKKDNQGQDDTSVPDKEQDDTKTGDQTEEEPDDSSDKNGEDDQENGDLPPKPEDKDDKAKKGKKPPFVKESFASLVERLSQNA